FHDDSYPSVKQFFRYVFTDRLGQFVEHSNRWVKFREYRWVKFGERQRIGGETIFQDMAPAFSAQ
ncbi:MAG: hypothetical protein NTW27_14280, partial [Deltaproteobacteria bacterium]|nr:hypothetical protein [Deltaproteobacteria bacterium]